MQWTRSTQRAWAEIEGLGGNRHPETAQLLGALDGGGAFQQVQGDLNDRAILDQLQERSADPGVETSHRWPTPELIVLGSPRSSLDGPPAGLAQIPAEHQTHAVLA